MFHSDNKCISPKIILSCDKYDSCACLNSPPNPAAFQSSFSHITIFPFLFIPSVAPPCVVQGAKLRTGPLKICKPASRPAGFGENFSIRPAGRLKIFHQKPCIFSPRPYPPPETSKVKSLAGDKKGEMAIAGKENWNTARFKRYCLMAFGLLYLGAFYLVQRFFWIIFYIILSLF